MYLRICSKGKYYYETIQINVDQDGFYSFTNNDTRRTYGYIYINDFDPFNPDENLIASSNSSCSSHSFRLGSYFKTNITYILVITTLEPYIQGAFQLFVTGLGNASLNRICKYSCFSFTFVGICFLFIFVKSKKST